MTIDLDEASKKVKGFMSQVDALLKKSYKEGEEKQRELNATITNFIRIAFKDGAQKLKDYELSFPMYVGILGREDTEEEKQDYYIRKLRSMRNNVLAYKEELQLRLATRDKSGKIETIEKKTRTIEAEARRRGAVADEKRWGATIELIDHLRAELKSREGLTKEIIELRKEIRELKQMFIAFVKSA